MKTLFNFSNYCKTKIMQLIIQNKKQQLMTNLSIVKNATLVCAALLISSISWAQTGNTATGTGAGTSITTGNHNSFFGENAGNLTTTGNSNVFIGKNAGKANISGLYNVCIGTNSGIVSKGKQNVMLGVNTGYATKYGDRNTFIGQASGRYNITGDYNTFLGFQSGYNTTGSHNVFIGSKAGFYELGSNKLYIENSSSTTPLIYGDFETDQVGINTNVVPAGYQLAVDGKVIAEELKVMMSDFWDDVFETESYELMTIEEKETFTTTNKHLPSFAPEKEIVAEGMEVGDGIANTVKELEEAYRYIYQLNDLVKEQQQVNEQLQKQVNALNEQVQTLVNQER